MTDTITKAKAIEFYAASDVRRVDPNAHPNDDGSISHPRGPQHRNLILVMKIPETEDYAESEMVAKIAFQPPQNPYAPIDATLMHPAREGEVDANDFLQAMLEHAWAEGFRPKEFADQMIKKEQEMMSRVDELVEMRESYKGYTSI